MERKNRMVSRQDAAEMLRCSQQTISNYVKSGVLKGHIINDRLFVDADTIAAITDSVADMEASKIKVEALKAQLAAEEAKLVGKINETREALGIYKAGDGRHVNLQTLTSLIYTFGGRLSERSMQVLDYMIHHGDAPAAAEHFGIPVKNVITIVNKALSRLRLSHYDNMEKRVDELTAEVSRLQRLITNNSGVLDEKVVNQDISVRLLNCLKTIEAETIRDVVRLHKSDFLRFRNFGRQSLAELDELLKSKGLEYGMNV